MLNPSGQASRNAINETDTESDDPIIPAEDIMLDHRASRPPRKPLEPGFAKTLGLAALAGILMGTGLYYLKPEPRSAVAEPWTATRSRPANIQPQRFFTPANQDEQANPPGNWRAGQAQP